MTYPLITDYIEAIKTAKNNFKELNYLSPVFDHGNLPIMINGSTSVVFKMINEQNGRFYAIKCFTKDQEGRAESYQKIAKVLHEISSPYFVSVRYIESELSVITSQTTETEFPVLLMDWVDGKTLDRYLLDNMENQYVLDILSYRFSLFASWLISARMVHGEIKPENILVDEDGSIVVVDYDGMIVPNTEEVETCEREYINKSHLLYKESSFNDSIDDIPLIAIQLSLKCISNTPKLLKERLDCGYLLFTNDDIKDLSKSRIYIDNVQSQLDDNDFRVLNGLFLLTCSKCSIKGISFQLSRPLTTSISDEDWEEAKKHGKGWFSKDEQRFYGLYNPKSIKEDNYKLFQLMGGSVVLDGDETKVICDYALSDVSHYTEIVFPERVETIGYHVFYNVNHIDRINLPRYLNNICGNPFEGVIIDEINNLSSKYVVNGNALFSTMQKKLISYYSKKNKFKIGKPTEIIGKKAFASNNYIKHIIIDEGVTTIEQGAFAYCSGLEVIDLPETLISIGDEAFFHTAIEPDISILQKENNDSSKKYSEISSLTIPCNVTYIGRKALLGIKSIKNESPYFKIVDDALLSVDGSELLYYFGTKNSYSIPEGVSVIYSCAFMNNQFVKTVSLPDSVTVVEEYAFAQCHKLTKVTFKCKHAQIKKGAFSCCTALKDVRLPKLLSIISNEVFQHCSSLTDIFFPSNLSVIGERTFCGCDSLFKIYIPDTVVSIGEYAFSDCSKIKELYLPKHLKIIEYKTFSGCEELELIHFPNDLEEIRSGAFENCKSIIQIQLPSKLKRISKWAFMSCEALEKCYLSNPQTQIDEDAFAGLGYDKFKLFLPKGGNVDDYVKVMPMIVHGCTHYPEGDIPNLSHQYENIVPYIEDIPLEDILSENEDYHWSYLDNYYKDGKGGIYTYGKQCFRGVDEKVLCKKYIVENETKYICNKAFMIEEYDSYEEKLIEEIILPDSIRAIGAEAFIGTRISNLILPSSLTYIGDYAFKDCHKLCSIVIPSSVNKIGRNPFVNTERLKSIRSESMAFKVVSNCLLDNNTGILIHCFQKRDNKSNAGDGLINHDEYKKNICVVPNIVKSIGVFAFSCAEVDTIIIPPSVSEIKMGAFEGNKYLKEVHISETVVSIESEAFYGCSVLKSLKLPECITLLNDNLFEDCKNLNNIIIPNGVIKIGNFVFSGCNSIKAITIPKSVLEIGVNPFVDSGIEYIENCSDSFEIENNILYTRNKLRLISCYSKEKELILPDGLQKIDEYAFKGCCSIERVLIPSSVTTIGKHAFEGCTSLVKVEIESTSLSLLQEYCFSGCKNLIDIQIPNSVSEIERGVFNNCSSISSIRLPKSIKKIDDWNFQNCPSFKTIWLPFGVKKETLPWKLRMMSKEMSLEECNIWIDDYGVAYSSDKRELIKADKNLTSYSILDGTEIINENAFSGCIRLKKISLPNSILEIKSGAFNFCGVEKLSLPNSVVKLGNGLFSDYYGYFGLLQEIVIPSSVEEMDGNPFTGKTFEVHNKSKRFMIINDIIYTSDLKKIISYLGVGEEKLRIANIVKVIGKYAFASRGLKEIIVPDSVEEIGKFAFYGSSLQSISLPETISIINESTFQNCGLKHIVLPQSITELKSRSFCDCLNLEDVSIPSSVTLIEDSAFGACRSLNSVTILSSNVKIAPSSFRYCDKLREIIVPKGCKERFVSMLPEKKKIIKENI